MTPETKIVKALFALRERLLTEEEGGDSDNGRRAANVVSTIAEAMKYSFPEDYIRQRAGDFPVTASEGLALLEAFISIEESRVRQAFLDAIVAAAAACRR